MTRGEASKLLNAVFEATEKLEAGTSKLPRAQERIDAIRDACLLLAIQLKLPVQDVKDVNKADKREPDQAG